MPARTQAAAETFQTFGPPHLVAMALAAAACVTLPVLVRKAGSAGLARAVCRAIALVLVGNELIHLGYGLLTLPLAEFAREFLPVHVCDAAVFVAAWMLWTRNQQAYEIAYFWGLAGTLQAILTPDLAEPFPTYWFFRYFLAHGGIVIAALLATWGLRMRPRRGAVLRIFVLSNLYMGAVALIDWLLGANYMFLREPPAGKSPFFFLPWPWYIPFLEAVGLALVVLLYLPFVLADRLRGVSEGAGRGCC